MQKHDRQDCTKAACADGECVTSKLIEFQFQMLILLTPVLLMGTALALAILRVTRPRFRFGWLVTTGTTLGAWLSVLLWLPQLPLALSVPLWKSAGSANAFATFMVSGQSWPYAFALATLALATILTAPARPDFPSSTTWSLCLAVVGLGLLAVSSGGPLTLVLFWAALDLAEAAVVLRSLEDRASDGQVPFAFAVRLGSMGLLLLGLVLGDSVNTGTGFGAIHGAYALLLPAAALLRLTTFAIPWPVSLAAGPQDVIGTVLHLAAGASSIAFLSQLGSDPLPNPLGLLVIGAGSALYAGWMWLRAPDSISGRSLWIMGFGSLAVAAALRGNPAGSTGWGAAMVLVGSSLFLGGARQSWMNRAILLGIWIAASLPFALTASAWMGGGGALDLVVPPLLLAQAMLLAGLYHRVVRPPVRPAVGVEAAWFRGIYLSGISLPIAAGILLGFWGWPGAFQFGMPVAGALVIAFGAALLWLKRRLSFLNPLPTSWIPPGWSRVVSATRREMSRLHAGSQRVAETINRTIEGEAGIMWSLLLLVLFVSIIARREP